MPIDEGRFLAELGFEVEEELVVVQATPDGDSGFSGTPADWIFDPTDIEREEVGLRGLLGAVRALEHDSAPGPLAPDPND
jgi:hypothetical protein